MVQVALVGLGDIGLGAHLPALRRHPDVDVAAVVDPVAERALATGLESVDLADVLASDLTAVVLATPPWVTPDLAVRCLQAGKYVLAEKPVATSVAAAAAYDVLTAAGRTSTRWPAATPSTRHGSSARSVTARRWCTRARTSSTGSGSCSAAARRASTTRGSCGPTTASRRRT